MKKYFREYVIQENKKRIQERENSRAKKQWN